jgi:molybdenum cofactor guanylyltransferase
MQPMTVCAGILAGGASSRMGTDKALLDFRGRPLIAHQLEILRGLFDEVLIAANQTVRFAAFGARVVPDVLSERCSLTGLHALIAAAPTPYVFAVACDMPYLNPELIRELLKPRDHADIVLPLSSRGPEPLHAVYSKACQPSIEAAAAAGDWKMTGFMKRHRTILHEVKDGDWLVEGRSPFTNVNTPDEWRAASP